MGLLSRESASEDLQAYIEELRSEVVSLKAEIEDYQKTIAAFPGVREDYESRLAKMKAEHSKRTTALKKEYENKLTALKLEKEAVAESVQRRITNELASIGIPLDVAPFEDNLAAGMSPEQALSKLNSLSGGEQREFYKKHKALLDLALYK